MSSSREPGQQKKQAVAGMFIAVGLALTVIALMTEGLLQWVLFAAAIGVLFYAVILASRKKKPEGT